MTETWYVTVLVVTGHIYCNKTETQLWTNANYRANNTKHQEMYSRFHYSPAVDHLITPREIIKSLLVWTQRLVKMLCDLLLLRRSWRQWFSLWKCVQMLWCFIHSGFPKDTFSSSFSLTPSPLSNPPPLLYWLWSIQPCLPVPNVIFFSLTQLPSLRCLVFRTGNPCTIADPSALIGMLHHGSEKWRDKKERNGG